MAITVLKQPFYKKHEYRLMTAGLMPFLLSAVAVLLGVDQIIFIGDIKKLIGLYCLVIVSFMSGIVWGISLTRTPTSKKQIALGDFALSKYLYLSNVLAVTAWLTYYLAPDGRMFFAVAILCFICLLFVDRHFFILGMTTKSYLVARSNITAIVLACLIVIICQIE